MQHAHTQTPAVLHLALLAAVAGGWLPPDGACAVSGCPAAVFPDDLTSLLQRSKVVKHASKSQRELSEAVLKLKSCTQAHPNDFRLTSKTFTDVERLDEDVQVFKVDGRFAMKEDELAGQRTYMTTNDLFESDLFELVQRAAPFYMIKIYAKGCRIAKWDKKADIPSPPQVGQNFFVMGLLPPSSTPCRQVLTAGKPHVALKLFTNIVHFFLKMYQAGLTDIDHSVANDKNTLCFNAGSVLFYDWGHTVVKRYVEDAGDWNYFVSMAFHNFVTGTINLMKRNADVPHNQVANAANTQWNTVLGTTSHPTLKKLLDDALLDRETDLQ